MESLKKNQATKDGSGASTPAPVMNGDFSFDEDF